MMFTLSMAASVIWDGRRRYGPGIFAIAFSLVLVALQCGIFFGLISTVTVPIVESTADIWVTYPRTLAGDLARPIRTDWKDVLLSMPEVARVDELILATNYWTSRNAVNDLVVVIGLSPDSTSLGPIHKLTEEQRAQLSEPGAVILDISDRERLDAAQVGDTGQINGQPVRVVGFQPGMLTLTGSCVLCSLETARSILRLPDHQTTFLLLDCRSSGDIAGVVEKIRALGEVEAWSAEGFANQTMIHWISKTKAGIAVAFIALLGLGVGGAVTSQTLYAATSSMMREFAALRAMGIPRYRILSFVMVQALVMSIIGITIGLPLSIGLGYCARAAGTEALLPDWLILSASVLTLVMGLLSGLLASQSLRHIEPATLLR